jgi:hypothetical protein
VYTDQLIISFTICFQMEEVKEAPAWPISTTQAVVSNGMSEFQVLHGASKFSVGVPRNPPPAAAPLNYASFVTLKLLGSSPVKPVTNSAAHLKLEKDVNALMGISLCTWSLWRWFFFLNILDCF